MEIQANGLTGHLEEFWESVGSNSGWLGGDGDNWERGPYYLDGLLPLAYLLENDELIGKTEKWIEWTLLSQREDGFFGPENNNDWWPRMVMLKVLIQYYEVTNDNRIIFFAEKYFRYNMEHIEERPLSNWGKARGSEIILSIYWLYRKNSDKSLLKLADTIFEQSMNWSEIFENYPYIKPVREYIDWKMLNVLNLDSNDMDVQKLINYHTHHIVNIVMGLKEPALKYLLYGDEKNKNVIKKGIEVLTKYHGVVSGLFTGDEHLSGNNPTQGSELCSVVEYLYSLEILMEVYEDSDFGDIAEKIAYNALPATFSEDMWCHQYDQQANQVLVTKDERNWYNNGDESNLFGLEPHFGCCTANMHQGWPKIVQRLWMKTEDEGLVAMIYAPSKVETKVRGNRILLETITDYPFRESIVIKVLLDKATSFPMKIRIPGWCKDASITVNGKEYTSVNEADFFTIDREWNNDIINIEFPMTVRPGYWYNNSLGVERGPLVFALPIKESWQYLKGVIPMADYEIYPESEWNYCLHINKQDFESSFKVIETEPGNIPFSREEPAVTINGKGSQLNQWKLEKNSAGELPVSPLLACAQEEDIGLIPYGSAKLRISQFPWSYNEV